MVGRFQKRSCFRQYPQGQVLRALGARSGVYAELGRIEAAAAELTDTEAMIEIAEKLFGPYRWGRYDMLVLPPSFPASP